MRSAISHAASFACGALISALTVLATMPDPKMDDVSAPPPLREIAPTETCDLPRPPEISLDEHVELNQFLGNYFYWKIFLAEEIVNCEMWMRVDDAKWMALAPAQRKQAAKNYWLFSCQSNSPARLVRIVGSEPANNTFATMSSKGYQER